LISSFSKIFNKNSIESTSKTQGEKGGHILLTSDYTLVAPININSPGDWALYPFISGNGSDINPYVIENIEIQGEGIKILEESGHSYLNYLDMGIYIDAEGNFTIRNCRITSISIGIQIGAKASTDYTHSIRCVQISNCGIGIYSYWSHIGVNISRCNVSNCKWINIKVPNQLAEPDHSHGGFGIYVNSGSSDSIIEFCNIQDCSIGVFAGISVFLISNHLINCGFLIYLATIYGNYFDNFYINNTVNEKPLGLFVGMDNLIISEQEASQYGQLIFVYCNNLRISNVHIAECCSIGLIIRVCENSILENIICENQQIGFFINTRYTTANNLYAKNCSAGFFLQLKYSTFYHLHIDNTNVPIYTSNYHATMVNSSIQIEKSTPFYIIDYYGFDKIYINSSIFSNIVPRSNLSEFDREGFIFQLDKIGTYRVTAPGPLYGIIDFTIIIFESLYPLGIPGFPSIWFYTAILFGMVIGLKRLRSLILNKKN
jgi:hypothetical protein